MVKTTYKGKLPKATKRGDVRPRVGGYKFTVGNVRNTTQSQMEFRLNLIREIYDRTSHWPEWLLPYLNEFARTGKIAFQPPCDRHDGAAQDAINLRAYELLRSYGFPLETQDKDLASLDRGADYFQKLIDTTVQRAIAEESESFQNLPPGILKR